MSDKVLVHMLVYGSISKPVAKWFPTVPRVGDIVTADVYTLNGHRGLKGAQIVEKVYWRDHGGEAAPWLMLGPMEGRL